MRVGSQPAPPDQVESTRLRLTFLTLLVVSLFVLIFARLWFLQVMAGERYAEAAEGNAVRTISLEAPRGKIFDSSGDLLVTNRYAYVVSVKPEEMGERANRVLTDLADLLGTTAADLRRKIESSTVSPVRPKPVAVDVPEDIVLYIWENQSTRYPGVYAELLPRRQYQHGNTAAHILGYVGEISAEQLESEEYADYSAGEIVGQAGVERSFGEALRGTEGLRRYEVDASGDVLSQIDEILPTPGSDLRLTIDLKAQQFTAAALAEGIELARDLEDDEGRAGGTFVAPAGAVVVLDTATSKVVAMASYPTYEPAAFVGGVSQSYFDQLLGPENHYPMLNRAIQSAYPPGSVFKVVTTAAALSGGFATPGSTLPCPGSWEWNGTIYNNWTSADFGDLTMAEALEHSCDTVFYELAQRMWYVEQSSGAEYEHLSEAAKAWGFGQLTGIGLPSEEDGVVPGRQWRREYWLQARDNYCAQAEEAPAGSYAERLYTELCSPAGARWRGGDAVNFSIGQGDLQATPLQVANAFAAIANGGTLHQPRVVDAIVRQDGSVEPTQPETIGELPLSDQHLAIIQQGLRMVTDSGTARSVFADFPVEVAGKTGTAEQKPKQPLAWYAGYNVEPVDGHQYVVVAMVEEGGGGSQTAAPIVRRVLEHLLGLDPTELEAGEETD